MLWKRVGGQAGLSTVVSIVARQIRQKNGRVVQPRATAPSFAPSPNRLGELYICLEKLVAPVGNQMEWSFSLDFFRKKVIPPDVFLFTFLRKGTGVIVSSHLVCLWKKMYCSIMREIALSVKCYILVLSHFVSGKVVLFDLAKKKILPGFSIQIENAPGFLLRKRPGKVVTSEREGKAWALG